MNAPRWPGRTAWRCRDQTGSLRAGEGVMHKDLMCGMEEPPAEQAANTLPQQQESTCTTPQTSFSQPTALANAQQTHLRRAATGPSHRHRPLGRTTAGRTSRHRVAPATGPDGKQHSGMLRPFGSEHSTLHIPLLCGTCTYSRWGQPHRGCQSQGSGTWWVLGSSLGMQFSLHCWAHTATYTWGRHPPPACGQSCGFGPGC